MFAKYKVFVNVNSEKPNVLSTLMTCPLFAIVISIPY